MAIARDAATQVTDTGAAASSLTYSHTVGSGSNRYLIVSASQFTNSISGVTYAGVAMTKGAESASDASVGVVSIWYLANPASGANNVVVTGPNASFIIQSGAVSYTGVNNAAPEATTTGTATTGTSINSTLTTITDNDWTVITAQTFGTNANGTNATLQSSKAGDGNAIWDSNAAVTPPGSFTMSPTAANGHWAWAEMTMQPFSPSAGSSRRMMTGIG